MRIEIKSFLFFFHLPARIYTYISFCFFFNGDSRHLSLMFLHLSISLSAFLSAIGCVLFLVKLWEFPITGKLYWIKCALSCFYTVTLFILKKKKCRLGTALIMKCICPWLKKRVTGYKILLESPCYSMMINYLRAIAALQ